MINLTDEVKKQLLNDSLQREIIISFPDNDIPDITGENIVSESLELTQAISDGKEFKLGGCIAGQLTVRVINVDTELNGKRIKVIMKQSYSKGLLFPSDTVLQIYIAVISLELLRCRYSAVLSTAHQDRKIGR